MIAATALMQVGSNKKLHLFDTFADMTKPTSDDFEILSGISADQMLNNEQRIDGKSNTWAFATLGDVKQNFKEIDFPLDRLSYVEGVVLNTVPKHLPAQLAVCRIATDWYESTKHIITHAWPRISDFEILLLDDYDVWSGSRKAIDEYFLEIGYQLLSIRIDSGRLIIKLPKK
jgi:hypothetical protein